MHKKYQRRLPGIKSILALALLIPLSLMAANASKETAEESMKITAASEKAILRQRRCPGVFAVSMLVLNHYRK